MTLGVNGAVHPLGDPPPYSRWWLSQREHQLVTTHTAALRALERYADLPLPPRYPGEPTSPVPSSPQPPPSRPAPEGPGPLWILMVVLTGGVVSWALSAFLRPLLGLDAPVEQVLSFLPGLLLTGAVVSTGEVLARAVATRAVQERHPRSARPSRYMPEPDTASPQPSRPAETPHMVFAAVSHAATVAGTMVGVVAGFAALAGVLDPPVTAGIAVVTVLVLLGLFPSQARRAHRSARSEATPPDDSRSWHRWEEDDEDDEDETRMSPRRRHRKRRRQARRALERHGYLWTTTLRQCQILVAQGGSTPISGELGEALGRVADPSLPSQGVAGSVARAADGGKTREGLVASLVLALDVYHPWPLWQRFRQVHGDLDLARGLDPTVGDRDGYGEESGEGPATSG